jgi:asparagine synthase (glutamine-hydrolysing)
MAQEQDPQRAVLVVRVAVSRAEFSRIAHRPAGIHSAAMCGIAGILQYHDGPHVEERDLVAMRDAMRHRGPDGEGLWISSDRRIGLGHRRLAIVDLSPLGLQPMATPDERLRVVYNGEIYNFPKLRSELEGLGHRFVSSSDTEVLLHGYREWKLGLLDRLRGMFAFALYDAERNETLLARDPLGIKPLYVADEGSRLVFASEVRSIRRVADGGGLDSEALASFLLWGSIAPPRTLHRAIRAVPAGTWLRVSPRGVEGPTPFFTLEDELGRSEPMSGEEAAARVREALVDSARHHLMADVPVGAFLSGGVDSSALVGLLAEVHDAPVCTVNLGFDVADLDESRLAREAAHLYGADHHEVPIRVEEIRDRIPDALQSLDQPSIDGLNSYFVSEAAVNAGLKVAVSGVGGDELFGGYASFERIPRVLRTRARLSALPGIDLAAWAAERLPRTRTGSKLAKALAFGGDIAGAYFAERGLFSPREVRQLLAPEIASAVDACDPRAELRRRVDLDRLPEDEQVGALEIRHFLQGQLLRDIDAVSMAHSLEIRTPLVDRDLLRAVARVPANLRRAGPAKRYLREAPRPPVPASLWQRPKQGFMLPFERWLRDRSIPLDLPDHPCLERSAVRRVARDFDRGRVHWSRLWALLALRAFIH